MRHRSTSRAAPAVLLLACWGCSSLLGTKLEREVHIEVDPTVLDDAITATVRNDGSHAVSLHHDCKDRLRRVGDDGTLEPPRSVVCAAMYVPPTPIAPSTELSVPIHVGSRDAGTYRVSLTLSDAGGTLPDSLSLSAPLELP